MLTDPEIATASSGRRMDQGLVEKSGNETVEMAERLLEATRALAVELNPRHAVTAAVTLDCSLDHDLGLDSLGRVELLVRLEKAFNVIIPEQVLNTTETPRDLLRGRARRPRRQGNSFSA